MSSNDCAPTNSVTDPTDSAVSTHAAPVRWLVVLCAQWCGTCRGYREVLDTVAARFPDLRSAWIDIEDQADLVDDLDVETFPTVLIYDESASGKPGDDRQYFFGPMLPHPGMLQRQVEQLQAQGADAKGEPVIAELRTLVDWLRQRPAD